MTEPASTSIVFPIEDHVVVVVGAGAHRYRVQPQFVADLPRDDVIGAGRVSTKPETAYDSALLAIKRQATAKHDDAANGFAHHRVCR